MNPPSKAPAEFSATATADGVELCLRGAWCGEHALPIFDDLYRAIETAGKGTICVRADHSFEWDSRAMTRLYRLARDCEDRQQTLDVTALPAGMQKLLAVATAVKAQPIAATTWHPFWHTWLPALRNAQQGLLDLIEFIGAAGIAFINLYSGRAQTRVRDILYFIQQCGPQALGIVALISVLVGMILAYLGSVQLRLFGAEVYVANLVAIGMVREMGALMTAIIMAGRTGAAYAAQLGAMQANEEVDAITTLGISPMEYLVLPRLLALVAVMPLLCIFANVLGLAGGALVASGMGINITQFIAQAREAVSMADIFTGLLKSLAFAALIATAGCQAGLRSGRSSAAVGLATTRAVVNAIIYIVVADAALNILYDKLGI